MLSVTTVLVLYDEVTNGDIKCDGRLYWYYNEDIRHVHYDIGCSFYICPDGITMVLGCRD